MKHFFLSMEISVTLTALLLVSSLLCPPPSTSSDSSTEIQKKTIVGRIEKARIFPGDIVFRAKMDTGARNSSLDTHNIKEFERDGEPWVRFEVTNHEGDKRTIERKLIRLARIKEHDLSVQTRPVIILGICVGTLYREVEVNLVDRRNFNYPLLIGRSYMTGSLVVDPALKNTSKPDCMGAHTP
jgi:hypothetical protein